MQLISHRVWLLTGWHRVPLCLFGVQQKPQTDPSAAISPACNRPDGSVWLLLDSVKGNRDLSRIMIGLITKSLHCWTDKWRSPSLCFSSNQSSFRSMLAWGQYGGYRPVSSIRAWRMTSWGQQLPSPFSQELMETACILWTLFLSSVLSFFLSCVLSFFLWGYRN